VGGERISHQVQFVNPDVPEPALLAGRVRGPDELGGALDGDHFAAWADDLREINRGVPWPGPHIEHAGTLGDASPVPAVKHRWSPSAVLQAQAGYFLIVRT
jgi:hypothetical protein